MATGKPRGHASQRPLAVFTGLAVPEVIGALVKASAVAVRSHGPRVTTTYSSAWWSMAQRFVVPQSGQ